MTSREMGDSSVPVVPPAPLPVYAFYIGGDTPSVWTDKEIEALTSRWALPIFVRTTITTDAAGDARFIIEWLHEHRWTPGTAVAIDTEDSIMPQYLAELEHLLSVAGFVLLHYESKGHMPENAVSGLWTWVADWTGHPHFYPGSHATQYASSAMIGRPWDASLIDAAVPLHELHPPAVHTIAYATISAHLPVLGPGDSGTAVRRVQALLAVWNAHALEPAGVDGKYGPVTADAVRTFQRVHGIQPQTGTVTGPTWEHLLEG